MEQHIYKKRQNDIIKMIQTNMAKSEALEQSLSSGRVLETANAPPQPIKELSPKVKQKVEVQPVDNKKETGQENMSKKEAKK